MLTKLLRFILSLTFVMAISIASCVAAINFVPSTWTDYGFAAIIACIGVFFVLCFREGFGKEWFDWMDEPLRDFPTFITK